MKQQDMLFNDKINVLLSHGVLPYHFGVPGYRPPGMESSSTSRRSSITSMSELDASVDSVGIPDDTDSLLDSEAGNSSFEGGDDDDIPFTIQADVTKTSGLETSMDSLASDSTAVKGATPFASPSRGRSKTADTLVGSMTSSREDLTVDTTCEEPQTCDGVSTTPTQGRVKRSQSVSGLDEDDPTTSMMDAFKVQYAPAITLIQALPQLDTPKRKLACVVKCFHRIAACAKDDGSM